MPISVPPFLLSFVLWLGDKIFGKCIERKIDAIYDRKKPSPLLEETCSLCFDLLDMFRHSEHVTNAGREKFLLRLRKSSQYLTSPAPSLLLATFHYQILKNKDAALEVIEGIRRNILPKFPHISSYFNILENDVYSMH